MGKLFFQLMMAVVGWLYLLVRYRNVKRMQGVLEHKFSGRYSVAGVVIMLNAIVFVWRSCLLLVW